MPGEGGARKGALVTGYPQEASLKPQMMTHQLHCEAAWKIFFFKNNFPHYTDLKMISALWGIILSHLCCGTSGPPPPPSPLSARWGSPSARQGSPSREPRRGGGPGKGLERPPPPRRISHLRPSPMPCMDTAFLEGLAQQLVQLD